MQLRVNARRPSLALTRGGIPSGYDYVVPSLSTARRARRRALARQMGMTVQRWRTDN